MKRSKTARVARSPKRIPSIFNRIPDNLPSLSRAYLLTQRASKVGFDWPDLDGILKKLDEEMEEFREALSLRDRKKTMEEIGDLFFVWVNIARYLKIHPEKALEKTLKKFIRRFRYVETGLWKKGKSFRQSNLFEMDALWEEAKKGGRKC